MKLYKISQDANRDYDTFDSAVVVAESASKAKLMHPDGYSKWDAYAELFYKLLGPDKEKRYNSTLDDDWTTPDKVTAELIGEAASRFKRARVIVSSYNAG